MDSARGMADALLAGRMRLASREEDGAGGCVLDFEAASVRLSRRELSVLAAAEGGVANKLVAIEQSLACSTVSESLQTALGKLGFASLSKARCFFTLGAGGARRSRQRYRAGRTGILKLEERGVGRRSA